MSLQLFLAFIVSLILCACEKHYVSVTKVEISRSSLASSFVKTPDPRQSFPPRGEQLVIEWNLPSTEKEKDLFLDLSLIYQDYSEETIQYELKSSRGVISYFLMGEDFREKKGIMTYKAEIRTKEGDLVKTWKHKLWVTLIKLDED
jgi:hypothetical protein